MNQDSNKRKVKIISSIIISVTTLFIISSVMYLNVLQDYNRQLTSADEGFKSALDISASLFDAKYADYSNITDENQRSYIYNKSMSCLLSAAKLAEFTTYNKQNIFLGSALYDLYNLMEQDEYKETVISRSAQIHDALSELLSHPEDKQAADALIKLTQKISQMHGNNFSITFDDQKQVEQLIKDYFKAIDEKDYTAVWKLTSSEVKESYSESEMD